ncbi:zinc finger ccch domain-containing protein 19 [Quercus suber]|uniref:Zinc finger ccch domain-containing protein 19 n=1 Tax=Quercus suber TaxID=58331 RepID=A0AAW0JBY8_QUESU
METEEDEASNLNQPSLPLQEEDSAAIVCDPLEAEGPKNSEPQWAPEPENEPESESASESHIVGASESQQSPPSQVAGEEALEVADTDLGTGEKVVSDVAEKVEKEEEEEEDQGESNTVAEVVEEKEEAQDVADVAVEETEVTDLAKETTNLASPAAEDTDFLGPVVAEETESAETAVAEETDLAEPEAAVETDLKETAVAEPVAAADDTGLEEPAAVEETALVEPTRVEETDLVELAVAEETDLVEPKVEEESDVATEDNVAEETTDAEEAEAAEEEVEMAEETTEAEETEAAEEMEVVEAGRTSGGKRKRGKSTTRAAAARASTRKRVEEDVCFICFDGGDLVLCDRRGCPKAYHPSCINRDEAFFRAKGRWNCGWHLCSSCGKNANYMCYTCTFSLCKGCIKDAVILCVRGNKGFCETCMKTVLLIEHNLQGNKDMQNFLDVKFLTVFLVLMQGQLGVSLQRLLDRFKERLSLTLDELNQAKNPWKGGSDVPTGKQESPDELYDANNDERSDSDSSSDNIETSNSKRRRGKRRLKPRTKVSNSSASAATGSGGPSMVDNAEWASKELLEFVMHMKNGDRSVLSQFDVQALLLEYIKRNKLRDPRRKSQIICDARLESLFGKPRVGHFEMLKLLESHFLIKEDSQADDLQGSVVDTETSQLETDGNSDSLVKASKDKKRKTRKKGDERGPQSNLEDFAAIDIHNINLIYLRRNLVEELIEDMEKFQDKVVGSFVRIRISGSGQKQDLYRLVQVAGTCKAAEPYKVGKRMTDTLLEILNLNKTEIISIDIISNQEFTEDECKRLRQSIKCGFINRLTVGDLQEKAMALQEARVKDWLETEIVRLSHLRDRASEKGRRKEYPLLYNAFLFSQECVEKLQLLKTPEERQRRLEEIPEIHADPNMDPSYESEEDGGETDDKKQETYMRPRGAGFGRRPREPVSPQTGGPAFSDSWSGTRNYSTGNRDLTRNMSNKGFSHKGDDTTGVGEILNEWNQGRDRETQQINSWEKQKIAASLEIDASKTQSAVKSESTSAAAEASLSTTVAQSAVTINETEKMWHYKDPSGKVQGPFSMVQLRKWNNTGYFPVDLRIWRITEKQDNSLLLTDALDGKFQLDPPLVDNSFLKAQGVHNLNLPSSYSSKPHGAPLQHGIEGQVGERSNFDQNRAALSSQSPAGMLATLSVEVPKISIDGRSSNYQNDSTNLPSPTPQSTTSATKGQPYENKWFQNPIQPADSVMGAGSFSAGNGGLHPPAAVIPESVLRVSESNGASSHLGVTPIPKPEKSMLAGSTDTLQMHAQSISPGADMKNSVTNFQNLVQSVANNNHPVETQGWGGASSQKVEPNNLANMPAQPATHGHWGNSQSVHNSATSFSTGNPVGNFPSAGFSGLPPSDSWRHPVPVNQSNIQPPAPPPQTWGMGVAENQTAGTRPENQNTSWGPMAGNQNMPWGGLVPANANMNWGASGPGPVPGNATAGWVAPVQTPGNAGPGWVPPNQVPPPVNANPGWVASGQGPPPRNANPGWAAPTGNAGNNGDRFTNQRDRVSHGGDSGHGGGKPWNRQSSFGGGGGGGSRPSFKGQRVCKFHESGHCKKGASCDYLHP